ncbi:Asparaginyl-tRNA synthetase, cytoplasmic (Asparagine--tRNA ligase) (AsnRS), variant 2 [Balamuthia mandrillaris]
MVLVRQLVRGLTPAEDYTNALYGLMFSNVPSVNTLDSIHNALERPVVYRALQNLQKKLGAERFPLVPMSYYSHHSAMRFTPEFPLVAKVGSAEAGYGKMRFLKQEDLEDFRSVLALHNDYVTLERFVEDRLYDIRVQKIGDHYRAYKRENANWKGNVGTCLLEEIEVTEKFREWAEECGKLFGGMDILTVDAIHTADGKDWILEINDTASGFAPCSLEEDMAVTRQLVLQRLQEAYDSS